MGSKKTQSMFSARFWYACLAVGIIALSVVYTSSHKADIRRCEERLTTTVEFIKDQTDSYVNYNNIAVAKSLMRGSTVIRTLEEISLDCSEAELEAYADKLWLTGISVLDQQGNVVCEYTEHGIGYARLRTDLERAPVLDVIDHPQKTYVKRVYLEDGTYADIAVHSCANNTGAVLAYRHTQAPFSQKSVYRTENMEMDRQAMLEGIRKTRWPGRMEEILPDVFIDGGHNEAGIAAFTNTAEKFQKDRAITLLFSAVKEKNYTHMIQTICERIQFRTAIVTRVGGARAVAAKDLASVFGRYTDREVLYCEDVEEAFRLARAKQGDGMLFCAGSLYLAGEIRRLALQDGRQKEEGL